MSFNKDEEKALKGMLDIASKSQSLRVAARTDSDVNKPTKELKKSVEDFIKTYGKQFKNKAFIEKISSDPRYAIVKVLADNPDIFKENTLSVRDYKIPENDSNNLQMIAKHLMNKFNKITVKNFAENYQGGISLDKARNILDNSDQFFKLPSEYEQEHFDAFGNVTYTREVNNDEAYARAVDYLSGDIYKKLDYAEDEVKKGNKAFEKNVKELEKVLPKPKTLNNTVISIKSKWLDTEAVEKFLNDYLGVNADITYNETKGKFVAKFKDTYGNDKYRSLKINDKSFEDWFEKYINGEKLNVYVEQKVDKAATTKATQAMRKVDEYFMNYLKANPEVAAPIMQQYNRMSNNWVSKDYKKDVLVIPGANPNFKFRSNQLEFVNMAMTLGMKK
jgi:N12 class adenine-specific DNA methylase